MGEASHPHGNGERALTSGEALRQEFEEIWGARLAGPAGDDSHEWNKDLIRRYNEAVNSPPGLSQSGDEDNPVRLADGQAALCLSGGGIRSAAFALGVVQALACKNLLTQFHYLSTVSGGGYIGGWLSRWILSLHRGGKSQVAAAEAVQNELKKGAEGDDNCPAQIRRLREYTNFITPQVGLASLDTWTGIALYTRNVLLNWLVFGPGLLLVALLPNLYARGFDVLQGLPWEEGRVRAGIAGFALIVGFLCLYRAVLLACRYLPSHRTVDEKGLIPGKVTRLALAWSMLLPVWVAWASGIGDGEVNRLRCWGANCALSRPDAVLLLAAGVWAASCLAYAWAWMTSDKADRMLYLRHAPIWFGISFTTGMLTAGGCILLWMMPREWQIDVLAVAGPLWVMQIFVLKSGLYVGLRRYRDGDDGDREWLARLSALCVQPVYAWAVVAAACLLLPRAFWDNQSQTVAWITGVSASISGLVAILGGKSAWSMVDSLVGRDGNGRRVSVNVVINVATAIFAAALLGVLSRAQVEAWLLVHREWGVQMSWYDWAFVPFFCTALYWGMVLFFTQSRVNVNRFSLHGVYRNRLARAFLGAARERRRPNAFTGFDTDDNPRMHSLAASGPPPDKELLCRKPRRVLFPVINVALNLVGSDRLAWQERKAMSFTISPLASGSAFLDPRPRRDVPMPWQDAAHRALGAYIPSRRYGGCEPDADCPKDPDEMGISLATSMAISGAAASPNMGYNSSPATAFLMTLFNVRLGAWFANPAVRSPGDWRSAGPKDALLPLIWELAGRTNEWDRFIYLSDGGHFENLGVYEMVRRRCRYIVVSDATCDPKCGFEDLGNLVRKAFTDLGVTIEFRRIRIAARPPAGTKPEAGAVAFALGTITYPDGPPGRILYLKPSFFSDLPLDVRAYASAHGVFPHEPTSDQWFTESQFESYRRLGYFLASELGGRDKTHGDMAGFFNMVEQQAAGQAKEG